MKRDFSDFVPPLRYQPKQEVVKETPALSPLEMIEWAREILSNNQRNLAKVEQLRLLFGVRVHKNKSRRPHNKKL